MISVIIPAYNRAELIGATLRSLLQQTLAAGEIIVVDDGSRDETAKIAESFGRPVRVIRQSNQGPGAARNRGFAESKGEYIHFFDSDDLAAPNKHELQRAALEQSGGDIAFGPWLKGAFQADRFIPAGHVLQQKGLPQGDLVQALLTTWSIVPHACLFRRSIVEQSGGFPPGLHVAEDQLMFLRCLLAGAQVVHTPDTLELYRLGTANKITESSQTRMRRALDWAAFLVEAQAVCRRHGVDPGKWFGFRLRAWAAANDLKRSDPGDGEVAATLRKVWANGTPGSFYAISARLSRWRGGLQQRLTGDRAHPEFRSGPLTSAQVALIKSLGFTDGRR